MPNATLNVPVLIFQSIEELEAEMLNGQKLQGPPTAFEVNYMLKSKKMEDRWRLQFVFKEDRIFWNYPIFIDNIVTYLYSFILLWRTNDNLKASSYTDVKH